MSLDSFNTSNFTCLSSLLRTSARTEDVVLLSETETEMKATPDLKHKNS